MKVVRVKYTLGIFISLLIVFFTVKALCFDLYNSFENWFIDDKNSLIGDSSFSPFTTQINLFTALISLISIPFFILKIIDPTYKVPKTLYIIRYITASNLLLVFLTVALILTPGLSIYLNDFQRAFIRMFCKETLYTHFLTPISFTLSFLLLEDFNIIYKKERRLTLLPFLLYSVEIILFMFILKSWEEDLYLLQTINNSIGFIGIILALIVILIVINIASYITCKLKTKISNKYEYKYKRENNR